MIGMNTAKLREGFESLVMDIEAVLADKVAMAEDLARLREELETLTCEHRQLGEDFDQAIGSLDRARVTLKKLRGQAKLRKQGKRSHDPR